MIFKVYIHDEPSFDRFCEKEANDSLNSELQANVPTGFPCFIFYEKQDTDNKPCYSAEYCYPSDFEDIKKRNRSRLRNGGMSRAIKGGIDATRQKCIKIVFKKA